MASDEEVELLAASEVGRGSGIITASVVGVAAFLMAYKIKGSWITDKAPILALGAFGAVAIAIM